MDKSPYTTVDQANNGLPLLPTQQNNGKESSFRRIAPSSPAPTPPSHVEAEQRETPGYPLVRRPGAEHREPPASAGWAPWWEEEALTVSDVMTTDPRTVHPEASIREIADIMLQEDVGVVPVVEGDGRLRGVVTDRDIVIRGLVNGQSVENCCASDVATTNLEVASLHDSLLDVIELMGRERIRRVPVLDEQDKLVGILTMADIANRADYREDLQRAFQKISGRRSFWSRMWR